MNKQTQTQKPAYRAPQVHVVGKALQLVQGYGGRNYDGYSRGYTKR